MIRTFNYSDDFDIEHHPLTTADMELAEAIADLFHVCETAEFDYLATSHSKTFSIERFTACFSRIDRDDMEKLLAFDRFRWIQPRRGTLEFSITHN